jgi:hypothetical protein
VSLLTNSEKEARFGMFSRLANAWRGAFRPHRTLQGQRKLAFFADLDNLGADLVPAMLRCLSPHWDVYARRAYGVSLESAAKTLREHGVLPVQVFPPKPGRNAADIALVIDAMEQVDHADAFAIAAGDGDYARLALRLRERNKFVIVMGREGDMSENLRACCDKFIYVGAKTRREPVPDEAQNRPVTKQGEEKPALKKEEKKQVQAKGKSASAAPSHSKENARVEDALHNVQGIFKFLAAQGIQPTLRLLEKEHLARFPGFSLKELRFPKGKPPILVSPTNFTDFIRSLKAFQLTRVPGTKGKTVDYVLSLKSGASR